jgi:hypothetical protein
LLKKIQFQLLLADLALKLGYPRSRRLVIPHRWRRCPRRRPLHSTPARPPSAPQHAFPPKLQPPLVQPKLRYPQFGRQSFDRLPGNQPLYRGNLEFHLIDPALSSRHQLSPSRTVPYFLVSF